jgi:hypothetical protein
MQNKMRYDVRVIGPPAEVSDALKKISGVTEVTLHEPRDSDEGLVRGIPGVSHEFQIVSRLDAPDARPSIAKMIIEKAWTLVELKQVGLSLEEIFLRIVAGDQSGAPEGATPAEGIPSVAESENSESVAAKAGVK